MPDILWRKARAWQQTISKMNKHRCSPMTRWCGRRRWRKEGGWQGGSGIVLCPNQQASDISAVKDSLMFCQQCQNHAVKHFWSTIELFIKVSFSAQNGASSSEETKKLALFLTGVKFSLLSKRPGEAKMKTLRGGRLLKDRGFISWSKHRHARPATRPASQPASLGGQAQPSWRTARESMTANCPTARTRHEEEAKPDRQLQKRKKSTEDVYVDKLCFYFPPNNN